MIQRQFLFLMLLMLVACSALQQPPQPSILTAADAFAQIYSEMATTYDVLVNATTPTAPGAEPLLSLQAGKQIKERLDTLKKSVDIANEARLAGHSFQNPEDLSSTLRVIRSQIPTGGK